MMTMMTVHPSHCGGGRFPESPWWLFLLCEFLCVFWSWIKSILLWAMTGETFNKWQTRPQSTHTQQLCTQLHPPTVFRRQNVLRCNSKKRTLKAKDWIKTFDAVNAITHETLEGCSLVVAHTTRQQQSKHSCSLYIYRRHTVLLPSFPQNKKPNASLLRFLSLSCGFGLLLHAFGLVFDCLFSFNSDWRLFCFFNFFLSFLPLSSRD